MTYWHALPEWEGETCYIIGGGPSVLQTDAHNLPGRIIATNEAGLTVRPDADVLFFTDQQWLRWNAERLHLYKGPRIVTVAYASRYPDPRICVIGTVGTAQKATIKLSRQADRLAGWDSGSRAINLAYLMGCKRIVLIGFDMHNANGENFHDMHQDKPRPDARVQNFIPAHEAMARELAKDGVSVVNCTLGSALTCYPIMSLEEYHAGYLHR